MTFIAAPNSIWRHIQYTKRQETDSQRVTYLLINSDKETHTHTSREEGTDHEAEVDGGHSEDEQEDKDQRGVTVGQHCSIRIDLKEKQRKQIVQGPALTWWDTYMYSLLLSILYERCS